jgi:AraC-like DNA-binding protein
MAITKTILKYQQQQSERNQMILNLFDSFLTATEVAQKCSTTVDVVQRIWNRSFDKEVRTARRARVRKVQASKRTTRTDKDSVKTLKLFDSNLTAIEVAKQCGYRGSAGVLRLWQSHFGKEKCKQRASIIKKIVWANKGTFEKKVVQKIEKTDLSGKQIAKEVGCCFGTVRRIAKKNFENETLADRKRIRSEKNNKKALDLFYSSLSAGKAAKQVGLSRHIILSLWRDKYGEEATQQRSDKYRAQVTKKDIEQMRRQLQQEGYSFLFALGNYTDNLSPIELMCPQKHRWTTQWRYLKMGNRCGFCNAYKREKILGRILEEIFPNEHLEYQSNLGFLKAQKVDYGIRTLKLAIEHDGEQHFRPVRFGGMSLEEAIKNFESIQERDARKKRLCCENNYTLVRVRYDDELSVENINRMLQRYELNESPID